MKEITKLKRCNMCNREAYYPNSRKRCSTWFRKDGTKTCYGKLKLVDKNRTINIKKLGDLNERNTK